MPRDRGDEREHAHAQDLSSVRALLNEVRQDADAGMGVIFFSDRFFLSLWEVILLMCMLIYSVCTISYFFLFFTSFYFSLFCSSLSWLIVLSYLEKKLLSIFFCFFLFVFVFAFFLLWCFVIIGLLELLQTMELVGGVDETRCAVFCTRGAHRGNVYLLHKPSFRYVHGTLLCVYIRSKLLQRAARCFAHAARIAAMSVCLQIRRTYFFLVTCNFFLM